MSATRARRSVSRRYVVVVGLIVAFLLATTYPYSLRTNGAELLNDKALFRSPGILVWTGPEFDFGAQQIVIDLGLRSYLSNQTGPARILTISHDHYHSNLTIGQEGSDLIVRLRRERDELLGVPPYVVREVFREANTPTLIALEVLQNKIEVYVNNELRLSQSLRTSPFRFWDPSYRIALGNEHTWERPWLGEIHSARVTAAAQEINLLDRDQLAKAGFADQLVRKFSLFSDRASDLIVNLLAMVPIGFLTAWAFRRHHVARSMALWLIVVICVEAVQVLLPNRYPALSDLVLNVLGIGLGAWLWIRLNRARPRPRDSLRDHEP